MTSTMRVGLWATTTAVTLVGLEAALVLAVRSQGRQVLAPGPASLDEVVGTLAAAAALLLGAWLAVSSTAAVLAHAPGRLGTLSGRLASTCAPLLTRRVAAVLVGAAVGSGLAPATALAADASPFAGFRASAPRQVAPHRTVTAEPAAAPRSVPAPGWSDPPDRATGSTAPSTPAAGWTPSRPVQRRVPTLALVTSGAAQDGHGEVVVHRGDTLWDLVAAHLGAGASDAEVARAWPAWHAANRAVIGADPDLLLPGQRLVVPTAVTR